MDSAHKSTRKWPAYTIKDLERWLDTGKYRDMDERTAILAEIKARKSSTLPWQQSLDLALKAPR